MVKLMTTIITVLSSYFICYVTYCILVILTFNKQNVYFCDEIYDELDVAHFFIIFC